MYKSKHIIGKRNGKIHRFALFFTVLMLLCGVLSLFHFTLSHVSADEDSSVNKLQNGSFEYGPTFSGNYSQPDQNDVPSWNTTAFQGKIELFKENTNTYIPGVTLKPSDGTYAAELNADEESTLYQNVKTSPSSIYEWGLDHGARNGTDTMALVIGPKQSVNPSKPSKEGRDQLMQMVDWLIEQGKASVKTSAGIDEQITVYSKKFAEKGTFEDNAGNNPFSLTPSTIYTEEWHIWIMASSRATSGTNPWNSYGSNAASDTTSSSGNAGLDLNKYYLYTVPAGQTETVFGFVSVGYVNSITTPDKAKTYGNFIDNINFELYHPLSGSTTTHGSAVVGGSDGTTSGTGSSSGHTVTIDNKLTTYVVDGEPLKIQAIVNKEDADDGCEFVGVYRTKPDENGNPVTEFLRLAGNEIEDTGSLTDEQKAGKWVKSTNANGYTIYTYYLDKLNSATDLHFVFIKSPTVTYDPNGGKPYKVERKYNTDEAANVYSFKPVTGSGEAQAGTETLFIDPYVSHAAEGQNDGWKFMGWLLMGDVFGGDLTDIAQVNADKLGSLILPAEHTIACDYTLDGVGNDQKAQYFKIYDGNVNLNKSIIVNDENGEDTGVTWKDNSEQKLYANVHKGLTMVAQWRWRQAIIPQTQKPDGSAYDDSDVGGTVEFTSVADKSNENYNDAYNGSGGKAYYAATDERITITATAKEGYSFLGWYDESGNLVTTNTEYSYVETQESVKTYYARFSNSVTQTYIRQVRSGDSWEDTTDDKIGTLGRYTYTDAVGMPISSTATAGSGYKFMGWYDSEGNKVADNMLINDSATISYKTTGDATYYARFSQLFTQNFIRQVKNGESWKTITDNSIATISLDEKIDVAGEKVSSKATAGKYYDFLGWYDSSGNKVSDDMLLTNDSTTISYTITGDATYYARFSKKIVTQTFIRQVKNGDSWEEITDDKIGYLSLYYHKDEVQQTVDSKATAGSGYRFVGWYDFAGKKVGDDMLKDGGMTISYTTTGNATYYARFEKAYTLNVSKIDGDKSTNENKVPLAGAEFTLYQVDSNGDKTITYNGESIKCVSVGVVVTALSGDNTKATAVFTDTLTFDGEYYLAETRAPTGYRLLEQPLKITFDSTGNTFLVNGISKKITDDTVSVELANYLTLHTPTSGTPFTGGLFAVTGLSLLTLAAIGLFWFKISQYKSKNK